MNKEIQNKYVVKVYYGQQEIYVSPDTALLRKLKEGMQIDWEEKRIIEEVEAGIREGNRKIGEALYNQNFN